MLLSYVKADFRNLARHKVSSAINVAGLAIGISASLVIYLIVHHEFNFDSFHRDGERIFRIVSMMEFPDLTIHNSGVPEPTARAVREELTDVDLVTQFFTGNAMKVSVDNGAPGGPNVFRKQEDIIYADNDYFRLFDYQWLAGTPANALAEPFQVVLTESRARMYFPASTPSEVVTRRLTYDDSITVTVSGVVRDFDQTTDFTFREFISLATVEQTGLKDQWSWGDWGSINWASQLFVRLVPGGSPAHVEQQLAAMRNRHRGTSQERDNTTHYLQPLSDIHFSQEYNSFGEPQAHKPVLYGLLGVAGFLMLIACINFINLTTAQSVQRTKEIGIRKTLGSSRTQLFVQFLGESFLLTMIATVLSIALAPLFIGIFRDFIPAGVTDASIYRGHVLIFLGLLIPTVTLLSGMYPALFLSRLQPVSILKNQIFAGSSPTHGRWLRKALTVSQFIIAQFLIIATIVVSKQTLFSLTTDLGYRREAIVSFSVPWRFSHGQWDDSQQKEDLRRFTLLDRLRQIPEITITSLAGTPPASTSTSSSALKSNNGKKLIETMVEIKYADPEYFDVYGMKLVAGRTLLPSDTTREFVINETYAKFLGFSSPGEAVGHIIQWRSAGSAGLPIVGVLADFHTKSTHVPIKPLAFAAATKYCYMVHLALNPADPSSWKSALAKAEKAFKEVYPDEEFNPKFFDESIAAFYKTEMNTSRLLGWAAGLAIFISCLGLLGLVIHTTNSRVKEIGMRKVLGASATQIVTLLSKDFLSLVLVAFAVSAPIGWWAMRGWLEDFAYRTPLSWWVFALAGFLAIIIAILTISVQAVRVARLDPVKTLRYE